MPEKSIQDMEISSQTTKIACVPDGVPASLEKTIPMGRLHMRPLSVVSEITGSIPSH